MLICCLLTPQLIYPLAVFHLSIVILFEARDISSCLSQSCLFLWCRCWKRVPVAALKSTPPSDSLDLLFKLLALNHLLRINLIEWVAGMVHICRMNPAEDLVVHSGEWKIKSRSMSENVNSIALDYKL